MHSSKNKTPLGSAIRSLVCPDRLTDRHQVLVLTSSGAAEGAGGAGHDKRVALAGIIHHLRRKEELKFRSHPSSETSPPAGGLKLNELKFI